MAGRFLPSILLVLAFCLGVSAQGPEPNAEVEKAKAERRVRLIAAIEEDATQLKLPENRAVINAKIAAALWRTDEEHARKLFRAAVNDLIAAQQIAEANKNRGTSHDLLYSQSLRPQIINSIANFDPEFALDALRSSRPAAVERSLTGAALDAKIGAHGNNPHLAQQETNLEQRLIRLVAERDPQRAVALLKESIRKKLSGETLIMMQRIHQTDPAAATELARDVIARLASAKFFENNNLNHELLNLSNSIIGEFLRERGADESYVTFEEAGVRRLAEKVIATYVEHWPRIGWIPIEQLEPMAKRFSPTSFEPLKKAARSQPYRHHMGGPPDPEYKKLMDSNSAPDVLVAAAKRFDPAMRQSIYQTAASKYAEAGQYDAARALLNDMLEGELLEGALNHLNWQYANQLMQKGQYDAAETAMMELNDNGRVNALVNLAMAMINANEENRPRAASLLNRVRGVLPGRPENSNEMSQILSVISAMALADPAEAVRMLEPIIDQLNQLAEAFAIVQPFQGSHGVRDGEFILTHGPSIGVHIDQNIFRMIGMKAPDAADRLVDSFARREVRVMMRLYLLD